MENKYQTLQTIYELVKNETDPTSRVIHPNEIILRQNFPWDESLKYLDELKSENLVKILQQSTTEIFITNEGFQYMIAAKMNARKSWSAA